MKGRNSQVSRVYRVLSILEGAPHGLTVSDLAERLQERGFEVGKRTIYRDLDALRAAGFPLEERGKSDEQGTRWTLERNAKVNHYLVLSSRELMGLYLARSVLSPLKDTPFYQDLVSTFQKIEEKLGNKSQGFLEELGQELHFEPGPRWGLGINPDVVDTIRAACNERQLLRVQYSSTNSGKTSHRKIGPHFLYFAKGSLYLVAEDIDEKTVKIFSVPRIGEATMLDQAYSGQISDPEEYFSASFGIYRGEKPEQVRVQFGPKVAAYVRERRWHSSQRVIAKEHGSIEIQMEVAQTPELVQWILGFGSQATVIEPEELATAIQNEAKETIDQYQTKKLTTKKAG
jgi:predicted DNA-binding transcriptional regulator YafY